MMSHAISWSPMESHDGISWMFHGHCNVSRFLLRCRLVSVGLLPCLKMSHPVSCWLFESHGSLMMSHNVS